MKFRNCFLLLIFSLTAPAVASSLETALQQLESEAYLERQQARDDLYTLLAQSTLPEATESGWSEMEERLLTIAMDPEAGLASRIFMTRLLARAGTERSAQGLFDLAADAQVHPELRDHAVQALANIPGERVDELLLKGLQSASSEASTAWWQGLAHRPEETIVPHLLRQLDSGELVFNADSILALGKLGGDAVGAYLYARWREEGNLLRLPLEHALLNSGACPVEGLVDLLENGSDGSVRLGAFSELLSIAPEQMHEFYASLLEGSATPERHRFIQTALSSGQEAFWEITLAKLRSLEIVEIATVLVAIGDNNRNELGPLVRSYAANNIRLIQQAAYLALGQIADRESIALLIRGSSSEDPIVREFAMEALARVEDPGLDQNLLESAANPDSSTRAHVLSILAIRNSPGAVNLLNLLFQEEPDGDSANQVLGALAAIGDVESCGRMLDYITAYPDAANVRQVQIALKRLALRLAIPEVLWEEVFLPAYLEAPDLAGKVRVVEILDCLSNDEAMELCAGLVDNSQTMELRDAAESSMRRWGSLNILPYWLNRATSRDLPAEKTAYAAESIARLLDPDIVPVSEWRIAMRAIEVLDAVQDPELRRIILRSLARREDLFNAVDERLDPRRELLEIFGEFK